MGLEGISEQKTTSRRIYTSPVGLRGIAEQLPDNTRYIRVVSYRQIPLSNVTVTVHNIGGNEMATTNAEGIATIYPDTSTDITIDLIQYNTKLNGVAYNTITNDLVKTIILDTLMHII
ncbi:hypothetical protein [Algoriphagus resistens]|uniref:hypothetical protein n=1 Tax=Algoriphagus resistens TaxID=1750590 RepID=UPI000716C1E0|nr:hypothetical protein [Algoriphagus resistens]